MLMLERERERDQLAAHLEEACAGDGEVSIVDGSAGVGKTRLLEEARVLADARAVAVLSARGGELERDFSFGIVRGLLEPVLVRASAREREVLLSGAARLAEPVFAAAPGRGGNRRTRRTRRCTGCTGLSPISLGGDAAADGRRCPLGRRSLAAVPAAPGATSRRAERRCAARDPVWRGAVATGAGAPACARGAPSRAAPTAAELCRGTGAGSERARRRCRV